MRGDRSDGKRYEEALQKRIETPRSDAKTLVSDFGVRCRNRVSSFCNLMRSAPRRMSENRAKIIFTIQVFCKHRDEPCPSLLFGFRFRNNLSMPSPVNFICAYGCGTETYFIFCKHLFHTLMFSRPVRISL